MVKKITSIIIAAVSCFVLSVSVFAVNPSFDNSVVGSQSIAVRDCQQWLVDHSDDPDVTLEILDSAYVWVAVGGTNVVTASLASSDTGFGYQFWYDDTGTFTVDMYSGSNVTRIEGRASNSSDLSGITSTLSTGVGGAFKIAAKGFDFITSNDLCMFMVSISFAGVALGFVSRAFKTARK